MNKKVVNPGFFWRKWKLDEYHLEVLPALQPEPQKKIFFSWGRKTEYEAKSSSGLKFRRNEGLCLTVIWTIFCSEISSRPKKKYISLPY